jgi:uncharacterized repeat protein (TIGR02543 family)
VKKNIIVFCLASLLSIGTVGCAKTTDDSSAVDSTYTVSFDSRGGSSVTSLKVKNGEMITAPIDPTFPGYTFYGWSKKADEVSLWDFNSDVMEGDVTLYAKWLSENMIKNGDFSDSTGTNWCSYRNSDDGATCEYTIPFINNSDYYALLKTTISNKTQSYDIQLFYTLINGITLTKNSEYQISFDAWSPEKLTMNVCLEEPDSDINGDGTPWSCYYGKDITLAAIKTRYTDIFLMSNPNDDNAGLHFNFGLGTGTYCIDNISLRKIN